jgi:hypothetical protein
MKTAGLQREQTWGRWEVTLDDKEHIGNNLTHFKAPGDLIGVSLWVRNRPLADARVNGNGAGSGQAKAPEDVLRRISVGGLP